MDNSAYVPNHLPPPSLVVFSQAGGLPEALRMQRPFNPQVSVPLSLPLRLKLPHQFAPILASLTLHFVWLEQNATKRWFESFKCQILIFPLLRNSHILVRKIMCDHPKSYYFSVSIRCTYVISNGIYLLYHKLCNVDVIV